MINLEAIKARCEAASEGPGFINHCPVNESTLPKIKIALHASVDLSINHDGGHDFVWIEKDNGTVIGYFGNGPTSRANADFWAHARQDIPALLELVEKQAKLIEKAEDIITTYANTDEYGVIKCSGRKDDEWEEAKKEAGL